MVVKPEDLEKKRLSLLGRLEILDEDDLIELKELERDADRILTRHYIGGSVTVRVPSIEKSALKKEFENLYSSHWDVKLRSVSTGSYDFSFRPKKEPK